MIHADDLASMRRLVKGFRDHDDSWWKEDPDVAIGTYMTDIVMSPELALELIDNYQPYIPAEIIQRKVDQ